MIFQQIICLALQLYWIVLIVRIVLSWAPPAFQSNVLGRGVRAITDPLLIPLRGMLPAPRFGPVAFDLSPLVLFFGIGLLQSLLCR